MKGSARGVTLIELMVGVAIMGILVGLSVQSFQGAIKNRKVIETEQAIAEASLRARQLSRATNQPVRLVVGTDTVAGASVVRARWEQLPCQDIWAQTCPSDACKTNLCGTGGCDCARVGEPVVLPDGFDASALHGVCWLGGNGKPVFSAGEVDCNPTYGAPAANALKLLSNGQLIAALAVEPLTGIARLEDCERSDADAAICHE